jgi:hypothetical protein
MSNEDVNKSGNSSDQDESQLNGEANGQGAGQSDDTDSNGKSKTPPKDIPYSRFKEVNDKAKQAENVVAWYRENIGDPKDVLEFQKWKKGQTDRAKQDAAEGNLSPEKLKQFRDLMRAADPEYKEFLDNQRMTQEQRSEAQFDEAEELIRDLAKEGGFPEDEAIVARVATHVMDEIKSDEKLLRAWQSGNTASVIKKAYTRYIEDFVGKIRPKSDNGKSAIAAKRDLKGLPSLPRGGSSAGPTIPKRDPNDKGITKNAHKSAWALIEEMKAQ